MRIVHRVVALWRALFCGSRIDADLAEEMRFHVERETEANLARGMSPAQARRSARLAFGSIEAAQERSRDDRPGASLRRLVRDIHFGVRLLRRSPVFAMTTILVVALGTGAVTAIFSMAWGVLFSPLPFREPDRLVSMWLLRNGGRNYPAAADALELRELHDVFDDVAFYDAVNLNLIGDGEPQRLAGAAVSANLFGVLGVSAELGRTFEAGEDQEGRARVVLLSHDLWQGRFSGDRSVIGRPIDLDGTLYTVVGVMPPQFQYPSRSFQAWVPLVLDPGELTRQVTDNYRVVARLAGGVTLDVARRETAGLASRLSAMYGGNAGAGMVLDTLLDDTVREIRPALMLLLGAVSLLLLIACANLSNLLAARMRARGAEYAVRLALGASRRRLVEQAVAEASPVFAAGGLLGIVLAAWMVHAFVARVAPVTLDTTGMRPDAIPRIESIALNAPVIVFSLALLLLTGLAASMLPAVRAGRANLAPVMKSGGRTSTPGRSTGTRLAVAAQIAFALPLLVAASLLIRSAMRLADVDVGFRPEHVLTLKFEVSRNEYPNDDQVADYYARLLDAVRSVPAVVQAGLVNRIPLSGAQTNAIHFETPAGRPDELTSIDSRTVTPDYFATMGIHLVAGRTFDERDRAGAPPVAIVDERIARTVWPGESAIGQHLREPPWRGGQEVEVVGVVAHVHTSGLEVDPLPQIYWSYRQWTQNRMVLAVRSDAAPEALASPVFKAILSVDPQQSVYDVRTMAGIVDASTARRRMITLLMIGFGVAALLLSAVGIYGVVAGAVTERCGELAIRIALGATFGQVWRLVLWQGTSMAIAGSAVGIALALASAGVMRGLVFAVPPRDLVSILVATALVLLLSAVASHAPARRAASVDPGTTLRT